MKKLAFFSLAAIVAVCASADTHTWKGGGTTARWSDATNWEENEAPAAGDTVTVPSGLTAWASHLNEANGGDLTLVNSLKEINLPAEDSVFEMDSENDDTLATATYEFTTPVTGVGVCKFSNGVNNDRHVSLKADNSAFQGTFHFYHLQVWIENLHALGSTNLVKWEPSQALHALYFCVAGTYANPIDAYPAKNVYPLLGGKGKKNVVLSGRVTNKTNGTFCPCGDGGYTTFTGGIDNGANSMDTCRLQNSPHISGDGIIGKARLYTGQSAFLGAAATGEFMAAGGTLTCEANNVLQAEFTLYKSDPGSGTLDLNGYNQAPAKVSFMQMTEAAGSSTVITSAVPAKLSISGLYSSSSWYTFWGHIQGQASIEFTGANNNAKIPFGNSSNTKGELTITNKGSYEFLSTCSFTGVKRIAILNGTSKYNTTKLYFHTAAINPDKFDLELNGTYAIADIDEGIELRARKCKIGGQYLEAGLYGSQAAYEAGHVDADHVLANLTGLGTLNVRGATGLAVYLR